MTAYDVPVEARDRATAVLQDQVVQRPGQRRLAAAGEAGEQHHDADVLVVGLVLGDDGGDLGGPRVVGRLGAGQREHLARGVRRDDVVPEPVVELGVTARGQGYDDHVGRRPGGDQQPGGRQRRPHQTDRAEALRGAGAGQRQQHHLAVAGPRGHEVEVGDRERSGDGDGEGVGVAFADLGRRGLEPPEGAVRRPRQRSQPRAGVAGQRQALRVDQLDLLARLDHGREVGGEVEGDLVVEGGAGGQGAAQQDLEVVQLARGGAVLGDGHRAIVPERHPG